MNLPSFVSEGHCHDIGGIQRQAFRQKCGENVSYLFSDQTTASVGQSIFVEVTFKDPLQIKDNEQIYVFVSHLEGTIVKGGGGINGLIDPASEDAQVVAHVHLVDKFVRELEGEWRAVFVHNRNIENNKWTLIRFERLTPEGVIPNEPNPLSTSTSSLQNHQQQLQQQAQQLYANLPMLLQLQQLQQQFPCDLETIQLALQRQHALLQNLQQIDLPNTPSTHLPKRQRKRQKKQSIDKLELLNSEPNRVEPIQQDISSSSSSSASSASSSSSSLQDQSEQDGGRVDADGQVDNLSSSSEQISVEPGKSSKKKSVDGGENRPKRKKKALSSSGLVSLSPDVLQKLEDFKSKNKDCDAIANWDISKYATASPSVL